MTLIICAIRPEVKPFLKALENPKNEKCDSVKVYIGTIHNKQVLVVRCGVGLKKAATVTRSIISKYPVKQVIMSGTAGGVDKKLKIGDTIVSEEILYHEIDKKILYDTGLNEEISFPANTEMLQKLKSAVETERLKQQVYFGRITSGNKFVSGKQFNIIADKYQPLCLDMETAAVAHVCHSGNIPFIAVRSVSDTSEKSGLLTFYKNVTKASESSFAVATKLL